MRVFAFLFLFLSCLFGAFDKPSSIDFKMSQDRFSNAVLNSFDLDLTFLSNLNVSNASYNRNVYSRWDYFSKKFDAGYEVIPMLRSMMVQGGVPQEFLFLAMAESEFSLRAYSPKKASGIWQLMPKTAKQLGLKINEYIDERRDPIKSTQAAIKYLKFLHNATGEWYLAAMAYNCGIGRLQRAIKKAGTKDIKVLIDPKKKYLPRETINYINMILNMSLAFNNVDVLKRENKEHFLNRGAGSAIIGVDVKAGTHLSLVAQSVGLSLSELKKYNKQFRFNFLPPGRGKYAVYIPYNTLSSFKQKFNENIRPNEMFIVHKVKKGETLTSIARKYKTNIKELKNINQMKTSALSIKQNLVIPVLKEHYKKIAVKE